MKRLIPRVLYVLCCVCGVQDAFSLSWEEVIKPFLTETKLPLLQREKHQQVVFSLGGQEKLAQWDWNFTSEGSVAYQTLNQTDFLGRDVSKTLAVSLGSHKPFQHSGGVLSTYLSVNRQEYDFNNVSVLGQGNPLLTSEFLHHSELGLSYQLPLLENRHNAVGVFGYKADLIRNTLQTLSSREIVEDYLKEVGLQYLEWLFLHFQTQIHDQRLAIALQEKEQMEKRFESSLVDRVDVLRAVDKYKEVELLYTASKQELDTSQAHFLMNYGLNPKSISLTKKFYTVEDDVSELKKSTENIASLRVSRTLAMQNELLVLEEQSLLSADKPVLDWWVNASVYNESEDFGNSLSLEDYAVKTGLTFKESLHAYDSTTRLSVLKSLKASIAEENRRVNQLIQAEGKRYLTELSHLLRLIEMDIEQKDITKDKTTEEIKMFEQGRSQYTFVLASRDRELQVELNHLRHVYQFHLGKLLLLNLCDLLLPAES